MPHVENSWQTFTCASGITDRQCGKITLRIQLNYKEIMVQYMVRCAHKT
jgi:hypothetical protein